MNNTMNKVIYLFLLLNIFYITSLALPYGEYVVENGNNKKQWNGKWFPNAVGAQDTNPLVNYEYTKKDLHDAKHGIKMGIPSKDCDDATMALEQDWLDDRTNYTCFYDKKLFLPQADVYPILIGEHIPAHYAAQHKCMHKKIYYDSDPPTFGPHRPLWAKYGEYKFVPKQRWLHNLEHGAIVMLYHPCANVEEVRYLRQLVVNCLYRHIITPYDSLSPDRPLALLAWGKKLLMSKVDEALVKQFIKSAAKHGPEQVSKNGHYDYGIIRHAQYVTNKRDDILCPELAPSMENMN